VHIEDLISVVGDIARLQNRPSADGDDLLAGQGTAAALDELAGRVGLIRAIDIEGAVGIVTRGYRGRPRARLWSLLGSLFINE
jgi:hypothetical protein